MDERKLAGAPVYDNTGQKIGRVVEVDGAHTEGSQRGLWIALDGDNQRVQVSRDAIREATPERVTLSLAHDALRTSGETVTVPLHEEVLDASTHEVERGRVRVRTHVETAPHEETVAVGREEVAVARVPVGQIVERAPEPRWEGDTLIVPLVEEVLVVEKRLRVTEELRVTRRRVEEQRTVREDLRREVAEVETSGDVDLSGDA